MLVDRMGREICQGDVVYSKYRNALFVVRSLTQQVLPIGPTPEFRMWIIDLEDSVPSVRIAMLRPVNLRSGCFGEWEVVGNVR